MISNLKQHAAQHLINFSGWKTDRKIVVIESDDWGSIRMPSREVYQKLLKSGVPVDQSPYCRFDSLASEEDLSALFEILSRFRDSRGRHPVITANTVVSNPDFDRIKASGFREYHCELITETFKRYPNHANCIHLWSEGIESGLFHPQSHGKEHLNVAYWLNLLQNREHDFLLAFDNRCWGLSSDVYPTMKRSIQASFDMEEDTLENQQESIRKGLHLFEEIFGYRSESFIASNYIWSLDLNKVLSEEGVRYLQGMKYQKLPLYGNGHRKMIRHYLGKRNEFGQYYLIRNCSFEPSLQESGFDQVGKCLKCISTAFYWNKPAIITSHRLNYIGFLDAGNRNRNLRALQELFLKIIKRWPDVEFMTSDQLGRIIEANGRN